MRRTLPFLFLLLLALLPLLPEAKAGLSRYQDKYRVLLVFAPSASDPRWRQQDALLTGSHAAFRDRDLLRFDIFERAGKQGAGTPLPPEGPSTSGREGSGLRKRYHVRPGSFRVILIGKDGHVAFDGAGPVSLRGVTGRIDRMPMRRDEMRRRGTGAGR